ncbi:MAG: selenocysteine-specific translation elongation factor [Actinomycetota bacterium]|nr:selenocysteine-specific translation elongation factor [Actinomycetota bacterium]
MPIVGTAGHVDHGKSTLVQALTGRDPDRWEEEKRRGLTIDLGFAWTSVSEDTEVAFVDVPGHERFIKNMLAGIEAVDVALLVVAADEGWKPQSEEHLAVLDLLQVPRGVVALAKADRVDGELLELAAAEVEDRLAGTSLEGSPIVPVSAPTGRGLEELRLALAGALAAAPAPPEMGRPRLWVDRSFTISGAGTVVTGTLLDGALEVGEQMVVWPGELPVRIRGLQSHEREHRRVEPGNRVAANLVGLERAEVVRGAMLGRPDHWRTSDLLLVEVRTARYLEEPLSERGAFHLHLGSGAWPARLRLLQGPRLAGAGPALVQLSQPLPVTMGDRFILREVGRRAVVGGGRVLDPAPSGQKRDAIASLPLLQQALGADPEGRAEVLLRLRGQASLAELAAHSGGGRPSKGLTVADTVLSSELVDQLGERALLLTEEYHRDNPLRPGMPKASLASRLRIPVGALNALLGAWSDVRDVGSAVAAIGFDRSFGPEQEASWEEARRRLLDNGLAVPRPSQLGLEPELFHALLREGRLVRVSDELVYLPEQLDDLAARLQLLPPAFTVADFRDQLGITRKYAVPILEWLDVAGLTVREGDLRRVRRPGPARRSTDGAPSR